MSTSISRSNFIVISHLRLKFYFALGKLEIKLEH